MNYSRKYVENPKLCPFCDSKIITVMRFNNTYQNPSGSKHVRCHTCKKTWREVWKMVGIEETDVI